MRLRNVSGSRERIEESQFVVHNPEEMKGHWTKEYLEMTILFV